MQIIKLKMSFLLIAISTIIISNSQSFEGSVKKNNITLSPFFKLKYERSVNEANSKTVGAVVQPYVGRHSVKVKPFIKFYLQHKGYSGYYLMLDANAGNYNMELDYGTKGGSISILGNTFATPPQKEVKVWRHFQAYGFGAALGRQWLLGSNRNFVIDWEIIGLNFTPLPANLDKITVNGQTKYLIYPQWHEPFNPGTVVSGMIGFGFRF